MVIIVIIIIILIKCLQTQNYNIIRKVKQSSRDCLKLKQSEARAKTHFYTEIYLVSMLYELHTDRYSYSAGAG